MVRKSKLAQSLPLNTIVIAILVIIVMLVIIVFFTTQVGESGDTLSENSAAKCSESNPAFQTLGYDEVRPINQNGVTGETCAVLGDDYKAAIGVSNCCVK